LQILCNAHTTAIFALEPNSATCSTEARGNGESAMDFPRFPPISRVRRTYRFYTRCWWASRSTANLLFVSILLSRLTTSPVGGDFECRMMSDGRRAARIAARRAPKALRHAIRSSRHSGWKSRKRVFLWATYFVRQKTHSIFVISK